MKIKILLIIIAILSIIKTYSQTYEPIVDTTKMWVNYEYCSVCDPDSGHTVAYKISNDSVLIDNKYWHSILESQDYTYSQWSFHSYIKEEGKIVFHKDSPYGDTLLYNFNLIAGDTCFTNNVEYIIENNFIDSFAGKNRYTQSIYLDTIYSGIGIKSNGLLGASYFDITGAYHILICYFKNDSLLYKNPNYDSCYIDNTTNNINVFRKAKFNIYPNPAKDNVQITMSNAQLSKNTNVFIYDVFGRVVRVIASEAWQSVQADSHEQSSRYDMLNSQTLKSI